MSPVKKSRQEQSIPRGPDPYALAVLDTPLGLGVMGDPRDLGEWQWQTRQRIPEHLTWREMLETSIKPCDHLSGEQHRQSYTVPLSFLNENLASLNY